MFLKTIRTLRKTAVMPMLIQKRNANAQFTMLVCTPPRVKVSYGEKLLHFTFMVAFWLTPMLYFFTQIKVWRREYIEG